jgi:hypothetical protein
MTESTSSPLGNVISIGDERIKDRLDREHGGEFECAPGGRSGSIVQRATV